MDGLDLFILSLRVAPRLGAVAVAGDATSLHFEGLGFGTFFGKVEVVLERHLFSAHDREMIEYDIK